MSSSGGRLVYRLDGTEPGAQFGSALSGGLDLNGTGQADLLVGAPLASPNELKQAGSVFIYSLGGELLGRLNGQAEGAHFGRSVRFTGDLNGDGLSDFVVDAPLEELAGAAGSTTFFLSQPFQPAPRPE